MKTITNNKLEQRLKELEQEEVISLEVIDSLEKKVKSLENLLSDTAHRSNELKQENIMLNEEIDYSQKSKERQLKRYLIILLATSISLALLFIVYSYSNQISDMKISLHDYNSQYVIQNLRGDTIDTWVAWNLPEGRVLNVQIDNKASLPQEKISAVKDAILSLESMDLDDSLLHKGPKGSFSTYYKGWAGAVSTIMKNSTAYIPNKFKISETSDGTGDIIISLVSFKNPDGNSGWTMSLTDDNQILKSNISIYQADEISADQLAAIVRHEFGHALGLAHSTAPEDLMAPVIQTYYPYISECDVKALKTLYEERRSSQVVCEK
jgi:hypothetical protein